MENINFDKLLVELNDAIKSKKAYRGTIRCNDFELLIYKLPKLNFYNLLVMNPNQTTPQHIYNRLSPQEVVTLIMVHKNINA